MTKEELFELLEIEEPAEFEYFEQLADLIECEEKPEFEDFALVLSAIDGENLKEITDNYFKELTAAIPADEELVSLLENIQSRIALFEEDLDDSQNRRDFTDELYRFSEWYTAPGNATVDGKSCSVLTAVTENRAEKLGSEKHEYDFPGVLDYQLPELTYNLGKFEKIDVVSDEEFGKPQIPEANYPFKGYLQ